MLEVEVLDLFWQKVYPFKKFPDENLDIVKGSNNFNTPKKAIQQVKTSNVPKYFTVLVETGLVM